MKFELIDPQITLIKHIIERDLYNQTNQLQEYKICLEEWFTRQDEHNLNINQEELQKRIDSLPIVINHLEIIDEMFSLKVTLIISKILIHFLLFIFFACNLRCINQHLE